MNQPPAETVLPPAPPGRLRPFRLGRDLTAVVSLIERAFGPESEEDRLSRRDVVLLRLLSPMVAALSWVSGTARDLFSGFVWEVDGQVVGNITISRLNGDAERFLIGNVAVDPAFRQRGIARRLTGAALDEIGRRGGKLAVLDVRADNTPAYALYRDFGFRRIDSTAEFRRPADIPPAIPPIAEDFAIHPSQAKDWRRVWKMLTEATPAGLLALTPIREQQVITTLFAAGLGNGGRMVTGYETIVLCAERGADLFGIAEIERHGGNTPHHIRLTVHPRGRGKVEAGLIAAALRVLAEEPAAVRLELRADEQARDAAAEFGFRQSRVLDRMVRSIVPDSSQANEFHRM